MADDVNVNDDANVDNAANADDSANANSDAANAADDNNGPAAVQDEASKTPGWMAQISDDLKANERLAKIENVSDLGTALLEAEGNLEGSVKLLTEDSTDEDKAAFFNKCGRPETPDGYEFDKSELPEGMVYDDQLEAFAKPLLHKAGLSQSQAGEVGKVLTAYNTQIHEQNVEATKKAVDAQGKDWGENAKANFERIARTAEKAGGKEFAEFVNRAEIDGVKLGNHPQMCKLLLSLSDVVLDDSFTSGDVAGQEDNGQLSYG